MERPTIQRLAGDRLHLSHGPIDVVLRAWGPDREVAQAYGAAARCFGGILPDLVAELGELRRPACERPAVEGRVARRMVAAVLPFEGVFVTPMAAVAGSVADELLAAMRSAAELTKAFVNDGGDIAIHVAPGESLAIGIAGDFSAAPIPALNGSMVLRAQDGIGGIATSGFNGRSFSMGIADSVTVLAANAAAADAAATLVANAVTVDTAAVKRRPASALDPDSDLGDRLVTTHVGALAPAEIRAALGSGRSEAERFLARGLIRGAVLMLRGDAVAVGTPALLSPADREGARAWA
jgi:ApbE superfamily uncharacterized protein (UPF0280 family)